MEKRMCKDGVTPFGRPPMPPGVAKHVRLTVRLRPADLAALRRAAKKAGVALSVYVLGLIRRDATG